MKQETLDHIKALKSFAQGLQNFWPRYKQVTSAETCDKYDARFNGDDRFITFDVGRVFFESHTGYYGNSSCSTFAHFNKELARKYFLQALNLHKEQLFETMALAAARDAQDLVDKAEEELTALQELVASVKETMK